jgi:hypothetical protein
MNEQKDSYQLTVSRNDKQRTPQQLDVEVQSSTRTSRNIIEQVTFKNARDRVWSAFRKVFLTDQEREYLKAEYQESIHHPTAYPELNESQIAEEKQAFMEQYFEVWNALNRAGLPTIPTLRAGEDYSVLMTDVAAHGRMYSRHDRRDVHSADSQEHIDQENDPVFVDLDLSEDGPLATELQHYAEQAAKHKILLAEDDPFQLLIEHGQAKIIFLDLDEIQLHPVHKPGTLAGQPMSVTAIGQHNSVWVGDGLYRLRRKQDEIRQLLKKFS